MRKYVITLLLIFTAYKCLNAQVFKIPENIKGNWLDSKTNEWILGLDSKFAMYQGDFWNYHSVKKSGNQYILALKKGDKKATVNIKSVDSVTIELNEKSVLKNVYNESPQFHQYGTTGFKEPLIKRGTVLLKGWAVNYNHEKTNSKFAKVIWNPLLSRDQRTELGEIDSLGRFTIKFELLNPQDVFLSVGKVFVSLFAVPGSELMVSVDNNKFESVKTDEEFLEYIKQRQPVLFMGQSALLNTERNSINHVFRQILNFKDNDSAIQKMNADEYKAFRLAKMRSQKEFLDTYSKAHRTSRKLYELAIAEIKASAGNDLLNYGWSHDRNKRISFGRDYLAFTKSEITLNDKLMLLNTDYYSFINQLKIITEGAMGLTKVIYKFDTPDIITKMKADGIKFTPEEVELMKTDIEARKNNLVKVDTIAVKRFFQKYQIKIENTVQKMVDSLEEISYLKRADSVLALYNNGIFKDMYLAMIFDEKVSKSNLPTKFLMDYLNTNIKNSVIKKEIKEEYLKLENKIRGNIAPSTNLIGVQKLGKQVWDKLLAPYKGKVVYVDFWAPWCGSCMMEMPFAEALKKDMEGKGVVFLYLANRCSEDNWKNTIKVKTMTGEHYLLSDDEYALLSNRFKFNGIPHYVIVDKSGNIININAPRPSSKEEIVNLLNKTL